MKKRWVEVTIYLPRDYTEVVSNFLFEQGATGVEEIDIFKKYKGLKSYFLKNGKEERIIQKIKRYLNALKMINPKLKKIKIEKFSIEDEDWNRSWMEFFKPFRINTTFIIKPPWLKVRNRKDQLVISIFPGMAFGTGKHPTTQMCIKALGNIVKKGGTSLLDLGTGSGILSIVAAKLGVKFVWAIDVDEVALENARRNIEDNGLSEVIKIKKESITSIKRRFDIIVANIDFRNLKKMRDSIEKRLNEKGFLVLSGILKSEEKEIRDYYLDKKNLKLINTLRDGEWICLVMKKL